MKKFYLMLAAMAALTMNAQDAQLTDELEIGDYSGATSMVEGSYWDAAPTTFYVAHTGTQMIYTADDLAAMVLDENKTDVQITRMTFRFANQSFTDITRDVKVYLQPLEATEFAVVDGKKQFFEFDATNPVLDYEETYELLNFYGDDGELVFDLADAPFAVTPGMGLLVTCVFDAQDDDNCVESSFDLQFYSSGIRSRAMTYTNNTVSFLDYAETEDFPDATSTLGCGTNIELPVTHIDYSYSETIETAIADVKADRAADAAYYDMTVRMVDAANLTPGLYIHAGKKIVVK